MTSRNETTDEFEMFNMIKQSGGHTYRGPEVRQDDRFEREVSQVHRERDEQQRSLGGNQFTYFAGPARNTFRADFDKDRNGINIAAMVGFNKATSKPGLA
jgi:hypothetical protein